MKYIEKQAEPPEFTEWKQQANEDWQPTYEDLRGQEKTAVHTALMEEQGHICCYCEQRLDPDDSHIEHFQPQRGEQSDPQVDPLDFTNMLCSCQKQIEKRAPRHCGNLKGNFNANLLISPLDPVCETAFNFTADGHIQPREEQDQAATTTIDKLGLNIPKLRALRQQTIEPFLDSRLSPEDFSLFVREYLRASDEGKLNPFWSSINHLFRAS